MNSYEKRKKPSSVRNHQPTVGDVIHALRQTCSRNNKNSSFFSSFHLSIVTPSLPDPKPDLRCIWPTLHPFPDPSWVVITWEPLTDQQLSGTTGVNQSWWSFHLSPEARRWRESRWTRSLISLYFFASDTDESTGPPAISGGLIKHHTMQMAELKLQPETRMCFAKKKKKSLFRIWYVISALWDPVAAAFGQSITSPVCEQIKKMLLSKLLVTSRDVTDLKITFYF